VHLLGVLQRKKPRNTTSLEPLPQLFPRADPPRVVMGPFHFHILETRDTRMSLLSHKGNCISPGFHEDVLHDRDVDARERLAPGSRTRKLQVGIQAVSSARMVANMMQGHYFCSSSLVISCLSFQHRPKMERYMVSMGLGFGSSGQSTAEEGYSWSKISLFRSVTSRGKDVCDGEYNQSN